MFRIGLLLRALCISIPFALALFLVSCGGGKQLSVPPGRVNVSSQSSEQATGNRGQVTGETPETLFQGEGGADQPREIALDEALAELAALEAPEGVDEAAFSQLKAALRDALIHGVEARHAVPLREEEALVQRVGREFMPAEGAARLKSRSTQSSPTTRRGAEALPYRLVSNAPIGRKNRIEDLSYTVDCEGVFTLTWSYRNVGDYNQDGIVNIMDITPLAVHFGENVHAHPDNIVIDGNGDEIIDIKDITQLAANFSVSVAAYWVQAGSSEEGPFSREESVSFEAGVEPDGGGWLEFSPAIAAGSLPTGRLFVRVVAVDAEGNQGEPSNVVGPMGVPEILSISPAVGQAGTPLTLSATVTGMPPITHYWNFGGGAWPNALYGPAPTVGLLDEGQYDAKLTVSNAYGEDAREFTLMVTAPPPGMPRSLKASDGEYVEYVLLQWSPPLTGSEPTEYSVYRARSPDAEPELAASVPSTETSYEDEAPGYHIYWYWVSASNTIGESEAVGPESGYRESDSLGWNTSVVETLYEITPGSWTSIADVAGRPAITYYRARDSEGKLVRRAVFAINDYPDASREWSTMVFPYLVFDPVIVQSAIAGRPVLASTGSFPPVTFGMNREPDASGVWNVISILYEFPWNQISQASLAEVDGRPAISFASRGMRGPVFALSVYPDGSGPWRTFQVDHILDDSYNYSWTPALAIIGGRPAIAYCVETDAFVELRFAMSEEVDGTGRWNLYTVDDEGDVGQWYCSLAEVDGRPAISYYDATQGYLKYAINSVDDGSGEWTVMEIDKSADAGRYSSLVVVDDRPAISYLDGSSRLKYAHATTDDGTAEWHVLELTPGAGMQGPSMAVVSDRPAVSYYDTPAGTVNVIMRSE